MSTDKSAAPALTYSIDECDEAFVRDFLPYKGSPDPHVVWRAAWQSARRAAPAADALAALLHEMVALHEKHGTVLKAHMEQLSEMLASPPADARDADARDAIRDAARYRWLRDTPWPTLEFADIIMQHRNALWDDAIDAAIMASAAPSSAGGEA